MIARLLIPCYWAEVLAGGILTVKGQYCQVLTFSMALLPWCWLWAFELITEEAGTKNPYKVDRSIEEPPCPKASAAIDCMELIFLSCSADVPPW